MIISELMQKLGLHHIKTVGKALKLVFPADAGPMPGRQPTSWSRRPGLGFGMGGRKEKTSTYTCSFCKFHRVYSSRTTTSFCLSYSRSPFSFFIQNSSTSSQDPYKNTMVEMISGFSRFLFSQTIVPVVENVRSEDAEVAGIQRYFRATRLSRYFFRHANLEHLQQHLTSHTTYSLFRPLPRPTLVIDCRHRHRPPCRADFGPGFRRRPGTLVLWRCP